MYNVPYQWADWTIETPFVRAHTSEACNPDHGRRAKRREWHNVTPLVPPRFTLLQYSAADYKISQMVSGRFLKNMDFWGGINNFASWSLCLNLRCPIIVPPLYADFNCRYLKCPKGFVLTLSRDIWKPTKLSLERIGRAILWANETRL